MKIILLWVTLGITAFAQLPESPHPNLETPLEHKIRYAMLSSVAAGRYLDWKTTSECVRSYDCAEEILPQSLAKSKIGLAAFEAGMSAGEWWLSNRVAHRHPRIAIIMDGISSIAVNSTVIHNYVVLNSPPNIVNGLRVDPRHIPK